MKISPQKIEDPYPLYFSDEEWNFLDKESMLDTISWDIMGKLSLDGIIEGRGLHKF